MLWLAFFKLALDKQVYVNFVFRMQQVFDFKWKSLQLYNLQYKKIFQDEKCEAVNINLMFLKVAITGSSIQEQCRIRKPYFMYCPTGNDSTVPKS